jgi:Xaa-Pro dipeptidase
MEISRRTILRSGLASAAIGAVPSTIVADSAAQSPAPAPSPLPPAFDKLQPLGVRAHPIKTEEFQGRLAHAQRLMFEREADPQMVAMFVTPGTSLYYFTGIHWGLSERLLALIVPSKGDPAIVCPAFEADRAKEQLRWPIEIRVWQEDENPYAVAAGILADRGLRSGQVGIEEATPYVFFDGLRKAALAFQYASATPVTMACRARKSKAEIDLLRLANHATVDCYRAVFASLREGMTEREVADLAVRGFAKMGLRGFVFALFGKWAALPHGTVKPQKLREGDIVLIDDGCTVEGYAADVTRTGVLGKPTDKQRRVFETVRRAQDAALAAAQRGRLSGSVDDAARAVITAAGYGKDYSVFTHRLGHGIGLDGHEHPYLVRGSKTVLEPGMTFSDEPGIYLRGEFGVRCEDCMEIVPDGPAHLLTAGFSESLEKPCG